MSKEKELKDK